MKTFIIVIRDYKDLPVIINVDKILYVEETTQGYRKIVLRDGEYFNVKDTLENITNKLHKVATQI